MISKIFILIYINKETSLEQQFSNISFFWFCDSHVFNLKVTMSRLDAQISGFKNSNVLRVNIILMIYNHAQRIIVATIAAHLYSCCLYISYILMKSILFVIARHAENLCEDWMIFVCLCAYILFVFEFVHVFHISMRLMVIKIFTLFLGRTYA